MSAHLSPRAAERRYYLVTTTRWLPVGFVVGIFILVQTSRGLSIAQAATIGSVMGLTCFFLELPTSGFADAVGRRPVYLAAAVINVVAITAYAVAQSFWAFVVAGALMGAFRALDSGPARGLVRRLRARDDTRRRRRPAALARRIDPRGGDRGGRGALGPAHLVEPAATVLGNEEHPRSTSPSGCRRPCPSCTSSWRGRHEGTAPHAGSERTRIAHALTEARQTPDVIKSGLVLLGRNRVLMGIVAAEVFWSIGMITFEAFMPLRLEEMVGSAQEAGALVGPVSAAGWGLFSVGAWLAGMTSARIGVARAAIVGRVLNALGAVVMGLVMGPAGLIAAYLFTYSMHGLNGPPHEALLHREAQAKNRSTVLSINSMMAFLAFGIAGPVLGLMADRVSLPAAMVTAGAVSILGAFFYLPARRAEKARSVLPAEAETLAR